MSAPSPIERRLSPAVAAALLLRLALGGLFVYAGVLKLADVGKFAEDIANYRFLAGLAPFMAVTLPAIEIVLGLAWIAGPRPWRRAAGVGVTGLLAVFTVAVTQALARGINVDCGCFGGSASPITAWTVARDVALLAAAVAALLLDRAPAEEGTPAPATSP